MLILLFYADVPLARQNALLGTIGQWPEVQNVSRLDPDTFDPELRRICFVTLTSEKDPHKVVEQLKMLPEVEKAEPPARRSLLL